MVIAVVDVRDSCESRGKAVSYLSLPNKPGTPRISTTRRLEDTLVAEVRHDRVQVVAVERISDPPQHIDLRQVVHLDLPLPSFDSTSIVPAGLTTDADLLGVR
jgi:hypothetical protein